MNKKFEDFINNIRLGDLMNKKKQATKEKHCTLVWVFAIIGAITAVAAIAYAVYKCVTPKYLDDFDEYDDFDDFDDLYEFDDLEEEPSDLSVED